MSSVIIKIIKLIKRKMKMLTNKEISDQMFDSANMINNVSRTGNLYGKLFAIKDMQMYLLKEENKIKEQIEREESKWVE